MTQRGYYSNLFDSDQFHVMQPPIVMAYYQVDFVKDPKGTKYWRNRILKVAQDYPEFQFAAGARKDFEKLILDDVGGTANWGEKAPKIVIWDEKWDSYRYLIWTATKNSNLLFEKTAN